MRRDDGLEVLVTLALPLSVRLLAEICGAINDAAEHVGYTDVALLTDGTNRVVARRTTDGRSSIPGSDPSGDAS